MRNGMILKTLLVISAMAFTLTGCSGGALSEKDDPQEVLAKAAELMGKEEYRASESEKQYFYDDGTKEVETVTVIFDAKKGVRQETTEYDMGFSFTTFNVKENDSYYVYLQESEDEELWVRYREEAEKEETAYEYYAKGVDFSFDEETGYTNVQYSNEGKETLDEVETIKIKITADIGAEDVEESTELTREEVLEENEWTEEEVALVDGFSEVIDDYVAANNAIDENTIQYEEYVWIDINTHKVVQIESNTILNDNASSEENSAYEKFNNMYWQMEMVHNDLQAGVSKEEAVKFLKEAKEALEDNEEESGDDYAYYPSQTKERIVERFLYDEDIPEMKDLPEEYEEMTEEEYYNGIY